MHIYITLYKSDVERASKSRLSISEERRKDQRKAEGLEGISLDGLPGQL